jgi:HD-like signal output (HDOD) protein
VPLSLVHQPTPEQQDDFDQLIREVKELRPLPAIALRLIAMAEDSRFSAQDLAGTIRTDQALTLKILRLANSPAFGLPRRITSMREAIVLLGFREVRALALAACVVDNTIRERIRGAQLNYETFWVNSLVIAHFAQVLAEAEGVDRDEGFTAGVVHNVGRLAIAQHRPEWLRDSVEWARTNDLSVHEAQVHLFGFTDADLGAEIARTWSFPQRLVEAVERHAWPLSRLDATQELDSIVARARRFARAHRIWDSVEVIGKPLTPDSDWQLPRVSSGLKAMGGVSGIVDRAHALLGELPGQRAIEQAV